MKSESRFPGGYVVAADEILMGCAGVELYGEAGLLRSVAVAAEVRGRGLGEQLTRDRIAYARAMRVGSLWLLTTTAPTYFSRLGFAPVDRTAAPESLRRSVEFAGVCPTSATCMPLLLDR